MKYCITFFLVLFLARATAQNQSLPVTELFPYKFTSPAVFSHQKSFWPVGLSRDEQLTYRPKSPMLMMLASSTTFKGENYWMGSMTTQSYNRGKLGTYYMWDVQGNLRESRTFFDIAGKNKRGLKLVFRRR